MRNIISYIAISLDGFVAKSDGSVDWLDKVPNPDQSDYGYFDFYNGIDVTIMGNATYRQVLDFDVPFPYKGKENYVFTRNRELIEDENVKFVSTDFGTFIEDLKRDNGKDIWLVGGGQMNSMFLENGWLDELRTYVMPVALGEGIPLFSKQIERQFRLESSRAFSSGVVELIYKI